jgi:hypothetical protein
MIVRALPEMTRHRVDHDDISQEIPMRNALKHHRGRPRVALCLVAINALYVGAKDEPERVPLPVAHR